MAAPKLGLSRVRVARSPLGTGRCRARGRRRKLHFKRSIPGPGRRGRDARRGVWPSGTRVNGILPARVATDRARQLDALSGDPDEVRAPASPRIFRYADTANPGVWPSCRVPTSPAASYITVTTPVDGGSLRAI